MTAASLDSVSALRECITEAAAGGAPVRITGRGTWLDAGRPALPATVVSTRDLTGIVEYVPGDLTLTARAGTTLAEIAAATAEHGQWLALDPFGGDDGTLGATIATASGGTLAAAFGTPRDLALGVEFVTGTGALARGGGRVVKNVAGFDLTRLLTGSWGTLGVLTEVTVRLHARPSADESFAVLLDDAAHVERVRRVLRRLPFTPLACEIANDALAHALLGTAQTAAIVRLGGNAEAVRAQRNALAEIGTPRAIEGDVWTRLRSAEPADAAVFRLSRLPSDIDQTWSEALAIAAACPGTLVHAAASRGIVRCIVPAAPSSMDWLHRAFRAPSRTTRVGERLRADLWPEVSPSPLAGMLAAGVKRAFDPHAILNPGILGEIE